MQTIPRVFLIPCMAVCLAAVTGCGMGVSSPARSGEHAPGTLAGTDSVTWVGADFRETVFADKYMLPDRLVEEKLAIWNRRMYGAALTAATTLNLERDLEKVEEFYQQVDAEQVQTGDPPEQVVAEWAATAKEPVDLSRAREQVKPFLADDGGTGVLLVVEAVAKGVGVVGHWIVFDRGSGAVHFTGRARADGGGVGVLNYYGAALESLSEQAVLDVKKARGAALESLSEQAVDVAH